MNHEMPQTSATLTRHVHEKVAARDVLDIVCHLLQVSAGDLEKALTSTTIQVGTGSRAKTMVKNNNKAAAEFCRDVG